MNLDSMVGRPIVGTIVDYKVTGDSIAFVVEIDVKVESEIVARRFCRRGHDLSKERNVSLTKEGYLRCLACAREGDRRRKAARAARDVG